MNAQVIFVQGSKSCIIEESLEESFVDKIVSGDVNCPAEQVCGNVSFLPVFQYDVYLFRGQWCVLSFSGCEDVSYVVRVAIAAIHTFQLGVRKSSHDFRHTFKGAFGGSDDESLACGVGIFFSHPGKVCHDNWLQGVYVISGASAVENERCGIVRHGSASVRHIVVDFFKEGNMSVFVFGVHKVGHVFGCDVLSFHECLVEEAGVVSQHEVIQVADIFKE